jgi:hypothetical protein
MKLTIKGIGTCFPYDYEGGKLPYKEYVPKSIRRSSCRFARMVYIAGVNALRDAGCEDTPMPVITSTALSEFDETINLLIQIFETGGEMISPKLVQNTVYNAPTSIFTIGQKNKNTALTITHSFLNIEAGIDYASTLFQTSGGAYKNILLIGGDEYQDRWAELLEVNGLGHLSKKLKSMNYKEGTTAVVLTTDDKPKKNYGEILNSGVFHLPKDKEFTKDFITKHGFTVNQDTQVIVREFCRERFKDNTTLSEILGIPQSNIKASNHLSTPLYEIYNLQENKTPDLLFISSEVNDIALLQIRSSPFYL